MQGIKAPDPFEEHAFEELVDFYQTSLLRMCYLNLHDLGLAEDAVQETFVKAYRAMPSFRGDSDIKTWLMRIAIIVNAKINFTQRCTEISVGC